MIKWLIEVTFSPLKLDPDSLPVFPARTAKFDLAYALAITRTLDDLAQENHEADKPRFAGQIKP
jgi:hypothetical protein